MRYPFLKKNETKSISFDIPEASADRKYSSCAKGCFLGKNENIYIKNSTVCTRPGILTGNNSLIYKTKEYYSVYRPLEFTDCTVNYNGSTRRLAYVEEWDMESVVSVYVFLVGDCRNTPIGKIDFNRVSQDTFYIPQKLLFFEGKKTKGCGLYCFARAEDNGRFEYRVFELDKYYIEWIPYGTKDFYVPTVYINGRGERYDANLDKGYGRMPLKLEGLNILGGEFKAYFSSDSYSSVFKLPMAQIDDNFIICKVYFSPSNFVEWYIPAGEQTAEAQFINVPVRLNFDRANGVFYFTSGADNSAHPIPKMNEFRYNNIEIIANKTLVNGYETVVGAKKALNFNSRIYFYSSEENPGAVAVSRYDNPLYIPVESVLTVGKSSVPITSVVNAGKNLLAFKPDGIYNVINIKGKKYSSDETELGKYIYTPDSLKAESVNAFNGCIYPDTLSTDGERVFWMTPNKNICSMQGNTFRIENIGESLSEILKGFTEDYLQLLKSECFEGLYSLWSGNMCALIKADGEYNIWHFWKFPEKIKIGSICNIGGKFIISYSITDEQSAEKFYIAELSGNEDIYALPDGNFDYCSINSGFCLDIDLSGKTFTRKNIETVKLSAACEDKLDLSFSGSSEKYGFSKLGDLQKLCLDTVKIKPYLYSIENINISFTANAPFAIGKMNFIYREFAEV